MSDLPFGFDDAIERVNVPDGEYLFIVHSKSTAAVSNSGNPQVIIKAIPVGGEDEYWPVRYHLQIRGKASGMFKKFLKVCGFDPDDYIEEKLSLYSGDEDAKSVAEFFRVAVIPELVGCQFRGRVAEEQAKDRDTGEPMFTKKGEPVMNVTFKEVEEA